LPEKLPSAKPADVVKALERLGFVVERQRGSHVVLSRPGRTRPLVVPLHRKELGPRYVAKILAQAGVSPEEFIEQL
jgi:predicted RNA binding protein YcfA (HicA-like mRNA interferase family)